MSQVVVYSVDIYTRKEEDMSSTFLSGTCSPPSPLPRDRHVSTWNCNTCSQNRFNPTHCHMMGAVSQNKDHLFPSHSFAPVRKKGKAKRRTQISLSDAPQQKFSSSLFLSTLLQKWGFYTSHYTHSLGSLLWDKQCYRAATKAFLSMLCHCTPANTPPPFPACHSTNSLHFFPTEQGSLRYNGFRSAYISSS